MSTGVTNDGSFGYVVSNDMGDVAMSIQSTSRSHSDIEFKLVSLSTSSTTHSRCTEVELSELLPVEEDTSILPNDSYVDDNDKQQRYQATPTKSPHKKPHNFYSTIIDNDSNDDQLGHAQQGDVLDAGLSVHENRNNTRTLIRWELLCVSLVFIVTLSVFPQLISEIKGSEGNSDSSSPSNRWASELFTPVLFTLFNMGDVLGRMVGVRITSEQSAKTLVGLAILRILFIPAMIVLCPRKRSLGEPNDALTMSLVLALGLSNGNLALGAIVKGSTYIPTQIPTTTNTTITHLHSNNLTASPTNADTYLNVREADVHAKEAGFWFGLSINVGLALGSLLSYLVDAIAVASQ